MNGLHIHIESKTIVRQYTCIVKAVLEYVEGALYLVYLNIFIKKSLQSQVVLSHLFPCKIAIWYKMYSKQHKHGKNM